MFASDSYCKNWYILMVHKCTSHWRQVHFGPFQIRQCLPLFSGEWHVFTTVVLSLMRYCNEKAVIGLQLRRGKGRLKISLATNEVADSELGDGVA